MIVTRIYPVLDFWTVEISCVHGDPLASHLVYREDLRRQIDQTLADALQCLSEAAMAAAYRVVREEIWSSDDCAL